MDSVDVLIVVDAQSVCNDGGGSQDPQNPSTLQAQYVYLITDQSQALSGSGGATPTFEAQLHQDILWFATSATLTSSYSVVLYNIEHVQGDQILATPQMVVEQCTIDYPTKSSDPLVFSQQTINISYYTSNVNQAGSATYRLSFAVLHGSSAVPVGYYAWDVQITVSQPQPPRIIELATVIDIGGIVRFGPGSQDQNTPAGVPGKYMLMVKELPRDSLGGTSGGLRVAAAPTDVLRWHFTGLNLATEYTVVVYGIRLSDGQTVLDQPAIAVADPQQPIPQPGHSPAWEFQPVPIYSWSAAVLSRGTVASRFNCAVFDSQQQLLGYYGINAEIVIVASESPVISPDQQP